jgi:hypothetical protein
VRRTTVAYSMTLVESSLKSSSASPGRAGIIWTISRALRPSTRESTNPLAGERVSFWNRRRGSFESTSTRSMSPSA